MGFFANGVCHATQAEALQALSAQFPMVQGQYLIGAWAEASGTSAYYLNFYVADLTVSSAPWVTNRLGSSFISCDANLVNSKNAAMFADGMSMGWGVVGAMFAALAIIFMSKALFK